MAAKTTQLAKWIEELRECEDKNGAVPYEAIIRLVKRDNLTPKQLDAICEGLHEGRVTIEFDDEKESASQKSRKCFPEKIWMGNRI